MTGKHIRSLLGVVAALSLTTAGFAGDLTLEWNTMDGGGQMEATGGDFELSGTLGQADAGTVLTGGDLQLVGGFWTTPPCWCLSDINNDGLRNGDDIQDFVTCLLASGSYCPCADLVTDGVVDMADVATFVTGLLSGSSCP